MLVCILLFIALIVSCKSYDENKPHLHNGTLPPYDGKLLELPEFTDQELKLLDRGEPVISKERVGKFGRGIVVQDLNASPSICIQKIRDLPRYPKMVPHLKVCDVYDTFVHNNGTTTTKAKFVLGLFGLSIGYYLHLTHEPSYNTLTWTLDYTRLSDMDDSIGHWQVMEHPTKRGWTRILYSTQVQLMPWLPEFVINFITSRALTEATGWLKRESELEQSKMPRDPVISNASSDPLSLPVGSVIVNSTVSGRLEMSVESSTDEASGSCNNSLGGESVSDSGGSGKRDAVTEFGSDEGVVKIQLRAVAVSFSKKLSSLVLRVRQNLWKVARRLHALLKQRK